MPSSPMFEAIISTILPSRSRCCWLPDISRSIASASIAFGWQACRGENWVVSTGGLVSPKSYPHFVQSGLPR